MSKYDFDSLKAAFDSNDHEFVRKANDALLKELDNPKAKSVEELLDALNDTGCSLARNFSSETIIPSFARKQGNKCQMHNYIICVL